MRNEKNEDEDQIWMKNSNVIVSWEFQVMINLNHKKPQNAMISVPWFPRHISELDKCSNCVTKYEPTTDPRHPVKQ